MIYDHLRVESKYDSNFIYKKFNGVINCGRMCVCLTSQMSFNKIQIINFETINKPTFFNHI